ncbi:MAG TPA: hypothetical protein VD838_18705, partial [Anaeromyxobacteraceae bacterium]|nr:hypothetical protein [Anaeromyxobacteraceae bacterium]
MVAVAAAVCGVALAASALGLALAARRSRAIARLAADAEHALEAAFDVPAAGSRSGDPHVRLARAVAEMARRHRE